MSNQQYETSPGFINPGIKTKHQGLLFADLLEQVAQVDPEMRIRFTSPHPKVYLNGHRIITRTSPSLSCIR